MSSSIWVSLESAKLLGGRLIRVLKLTSAKQNISFTSAEDGLDVYSKFSLPFLLDFHLDVAFYKRMGSHAPMLQISVLALHVCASFDVWLMGSSKSFLGHVGEVMIGVVMKQVLGVGNVPSRYFDSFRVPAPWEDPCSISISLYLRTDLFGREQ